MEPQEHIASANDGTAKDCKMEKFRDLKIWRNLTRSINLRLLSAGRKAKMTLTERSAMKMASITRYRVMQVMFLRNLEDLKKVKLYEFLTCIKMRERQRPRR